MSGNSLEKAVFAGGCFWCMEPPFEIPGVKEVLPGYTGGHLDNPTYEQVCAGVTGHTEAVQITFDPTEVSYETLLDIFWRNIDPTDTGGQFHDRGSQYRTAIFTRSAEQEAAATASVQALEKSGRFPRVVTPVQKAGVFWPAEAYHCQYHRKNPEHYRNYRRGSGRAGFLENTWGTDRD